ncbi:MAG: ferritin family protein [Calditrichia bacterium]
MADVRKDLEALKIAMQTEEEGQQLFKTASANTKNSFVKSIFDRLAKDELLHMDLIKKFYAQLEHSGSWKELSPQDRDYRSAKQEMKTIFSSALEKAKAGNLNVSESDVEVYRRAVQFEKDGADLYDRLYNETDDKLAKKFYLFLREMEKEHMNLLDNTLQYLDNPNNWYLLEEGWTLDD